MKKTFVIKNLLKKLKKYKVYAIGGMVRNNIYRNRKSEDSDIIVLDITENTLIEILGKDFSYIKINDVIRVKDNESSSHVDIYVTDDLETDLRKRDFTINTILYDLHENKFINKDFINTESVEFIDYNYVKNVPLSLFRAIRIALQNNIDLPSNIEEMINKMNFENIDKNNLRKEFFKIIMENNGLDILKKYGLLELIIPEFKETYDYDQNSVWHDLTLYEHISKSVKIIEEDLALKLTMIFHDLGKPKSRSIKSDGRASYIGHENESAKIAEVWLKKYNASKKLSSQVILLIKNHMHKNMKIKKMISRLGLANSKKLMRVFMSDTKSRNKVMTDQINEIIKKSEILNSLDAPKGETIDTKRPNMFIMIGIPRSGKSTFCKRFLPNSTYLSRDKIREDSFGEKGNMQNEGKVNQIFNELLSEAFIKKENIVIDNTNVVARYRNAFIRQAKSKGYNIIGIWIDVEYDDAYQNAINDNFPLSVMESMQSRLAKPLYEEGYNLIKRIKPSFKNNIIYKEVKYV